MGDILRGENYILHGVGDILHGEKDVLRRENYVLHRVGDVLLGVEDIKFLGGEDLARMAGTASALEGQGDKKMPGDWIKKRAADLIDQIDQFAAALNNAAGYTASGLTLAQFTNLLSLRDDLEAAVGTEDVQLGLYRGAVDARQATQSQVAAELRAMGMAATRHMNMTDPLRAQAGLTVRDTAPTPGILPVVDDCSVVGHPNGNNAVKWTRPAGGRGVVFEVEVSMGSSGAWTLAGATSKTSLLHTGAGAGVHRLYRIVCRRGDLRGEPGNEAAVYGS